MLPTLLKNERIDLIINTTEGRQSIARLGQ